ncbi:hypothetical protein FOA52_008249 [Chlamydomonas sp. UWO 241]|nr:hypothetical protein FOA52_008249 [Chlamydomonas sp. UWO 241]
MDAGQLRCQTYSVRVLPHDDDRGCVLWWLGGDVRCEPVRPHSSRVCGRDARVCAADGGTAAARTAIKCGHVARV